MLAPEEAMDLVRDRLILERDVHQVFLGLFNRLRDGHRHFGRFAFADADPALAIPDDDERSEIEPFAALDHLRDPVDEHYLVFETQLFRVDSHERLLLR